MKLKVRRTSASKLTIAGCDKLLATLKDRGPQYFAELLAAMSCTKGQLTFYTRRLSTQGRIMPIEKRGTMIRWGLPEHARKQSPVAVSEFQIAGRRQPHEFRELHRDMFAHQRLCELTRK